MSALGKEVASVRHQVGKLEIDLFQLQLARFDLGEVENVVEHVEEAPADRRAVSECRRWLSDSSLVRSSSIIPENTVHRCADLVTHVGQELRLGAVGALRHLLGFPQSPHLGQIGAGAQGAGQVALVVGQIGRMPGDDAVVTGSRGDGVLEVLIRSRVER